MDCKHDYLVRDCVNGNRFFFLAFCRVCADMIVKSAELSVSAKLETHTLQK